MLATSLTRIAFASFVIALLALSVNAEPDVSGVLRGITANGAYTVGDPVRITAIFENTGDIEVTAKLKGEVYINGKLIDLVESNELRVKPDERTNLTAYFTPDMYGSYSFYGHIQYSDKETNRAIADFKVMQLGPGKMDYFRSGGSPAERIISLSISVVVVLIVAGFILLFRRKIPVVEE